MSLLQLAANINAIAVAHGNVQQHLRDSGLLIAGHIRDNIDRGQVAGQYRPDDTGTTPGAPMSRLAAYTIARREAAGIHHEDPLKATGRTYREIGIRGLTSTRVTVGGTTGRSRRLLAFHFGTEVTGLLSSDLKRVVPPRNPVGYNDRVLNDIWRIWGRMVPQASTRTTAGVTLML